MKPRWMRNHVACPDCGLIINESIAELNGKLVLCMDKNNNFDCPKCKVHYSGEDFWELHHDKTAHLNSYFNGVPAIKED